MKHNNNPLSPHLQIYKWQISSLLSITHRIVGVINFLAIILICFWTLSLLLGENSYEITFVTFFKAHPHNMESVLRIALKPGTEITLEVMIPSICDTIIDYLNKVSNLF